jgi:hypothetical protein
MENRNSTAGAAALSQCIFCLQEKEKLTDEHVFPAALDGANRVIVRCARIDPPVLAEYGRSKAVSYLHVAY